MGASILQDLVVVMVIAAAATIIFYRLRQPVVLGYLLAGLVIGPGALGLIHDGASIHALADLGIIFLMFAVGLEFDLKKLRKVGIPAAIVAAVEVAVMLAVGYYVGRWMGWNEMDSIFLGAVISISSTTIIVKILTEMGKLKEEYTELAFGILIIEDLLAIVIVALLSSIGMTGALDPGIIGPTIGGVVLFVLIFTAVGLVIVPRLIESVSKYHVEEVLVITVVGLAFGAALMANNLGFSLALGAFLIGAIIAESRAVRRVEHKIVPIRDLFTAMFFVAIGMLIEPRHILAYWIPIVLVALATIIGKVVIVAVSSFAVGCDGRTSMKTATALGQIGEFSFIIAGLGLSLGVVREELPPIAIAVCAITSLATPWLMRYGNAATDKIAPKLPRWYVATLAAYTRAVRRLTTRPTDVLGHADAKAKQHRSRVFIYAAWLFGILIVAAYASQWLGSEVTERLSLGDNAARAAAIGFLGILALPIFVAFAKATEAYIYSTAKAHSMNPRRLSGLDARHHRPKFIARAVASVAAIVMLFGAIRVAWGVHPLAVPNTWLLVPVLAIIALVGWFARRRLVRVYEGMERTLNELMGSEDDTVADDRNRLLKERLPFGMDAEEYHVRNYTRAAYASLKALSLRPKTGATILAVERGEAVVHNPPGEWLLLPNDRLLLVGTREQVARAQRFLEEAVTREADDIVEESLPLPASSPAVGRTLGEMGLAEGQGQGRGQEARVGFVQKQDGRVFAASPDFAPEAGDRVMVYGPEASMDRVREKLKVRTQLTPPRPKRGPG